MILVNKMVGNEFVLQVSDNHEYNPETVVIGKTPLYFVGKIQEIGLVDRDNGYLSRSEYDWLVSELQRFVETEQKSPVWKKLLRKLNFVKLDFDNLLKNPQEHTVLEQEQAKILENLEVFSTTGYWEILQQLEAGAATYVPEAGI